MLALSPLSLLFSLSWAQWLFQQHIAKRVNEPVSRQSWLFLSEADAYVCCASGTWHSSVRATEHIFIMKRILSVGWEKAVLPPQKEGLENHCCITLGIWRYEGILRYEVQLEDVTEWYMKQTCKSGWAQLFISAPPFCYQGSKRGVPRQPSTQTLTRLGSAEYWKGCCNMCSAISWPDLMFNTRSPWTEPCPETGTACPFWPRPAQCATYQGPLTMKGISPGAWICLHFWEAGWDY